MNSLEILEAHTFGHSLLTVRGFCDGCDWHSYTGPKVAVEAHRAHLAEVLEQHMQEREAQLRQLVRDMTDPGECWFDHHGGCQEHGYLDLKPGELCPHAEAKQLLGDEPNGR